MADVLKLKPHILQWEGLWSCDPLDHGGATMKGITFRTYQAYCKLKGKPEPTLDDLKNISDTEWTDVLKVMFWDKWKADEIKNQSVANTLVDWYWGSGKWGIVIPQRILGVHDDGLVGQHTLSALSEVNQRGFFNAIYFERSKFLHNIVKRDPSQERFIKGWIGRLNSFTYSD